MQIVRESKYRHVFGTQFKPEFTFQNLRAKTTAWDQNFVVSSGQYFATPWQTGGGAVAVFKHSEPGKKKPDTPCFSGHSGEIYDMDFNPFNESLLATASFDGTVKIWKIPEGGLKDSTKDAEVTLEHDKKVGLIKYHPSSANVLLTAPVDKELKLWDIEKQKDLITLNINTNSTNSVDFNLNGSLFATTSKDKKTRIYDPRNSENQSVAEIDGHQGTKGARIIWLKKLDKIFTVGFTKLAEREMNLYDPRKMEEPLVSTEIDVASSILMPFYDEDTSIMYLAGKGDGNIRFYEIDTKDTEYIHYISTFSSTTPQRGMAMVPKYALDTSLCEITRLLKLTSDAIVPVYFQVPRKATMFQDDIYPDTFSFEPAQTSDDYFGGKDSDPKTIEMNPKKNPYKSSYKPMEFKPVEKPKVVKLPPKTEDPKELKKQNEELRKKVEELEKKVAELQLALDQQQPQETQEIQESETKE